MKSRSFTSELFLWERVHGIRLHEVIYGALLDCVPRLHIDHNTPCLVPQILHNLCLRFLLGRLLYLEETENNVYAFFFVSGVGGGGRVGVSNKVNYGLYESGEFEM